jgi:hypothetical protein
MAQASDSRFRSWLGLAGWVLTTFAAACGHAAPPPRSLVEDKARRDVPIAVCRKALAPTDLVESGAPRPEAYWSALFAGFQAFGTAFEPADCVGETVAPSGRRPGPATTPASAHVSAEDSTVSSAPSGEQILWLRLFPSVDKSASGLLALVRPRPSLLDVHAVGFYRGSAAHSRFELAGTAATPFVVADDEACGDVKVESECESTLSFYLAVGGELTLAGQTASERLKYGTLKDVGRVKWRLLTEPPVFDPQGIHIKEKLTVHDASDNEVRKLESERIFTFKGTELTGAPESLWAQVDAKH